MPNEINDAKHKDALEKKVRRTISKYKLFSRKERIAVAVSGGKDSTVCLYILKKLGYDVEGITIDAAIGNYTKENLENLKSVCAKYKIKLNIVSFRDEFGMSLCYIRDVLHSKGYEYSSCMICGILKRYLINKHTRILKFDAVATGHNLDDAAHSFVMNVFRNDWKLAARQGPVSGTSKSSKFVRRVKPLYFVDEKSIVQYSKAMGFPVNYGICPCSVDAYRREYRNMFAEFEKKHPDVKNNIVKFQETMKSKTTHMRSEDIPTCSSCGEPASGEVCKACELIAALKSEKNKAKK